MKPTEKNFQFLCFLLQKMNQFKISFFLLFALFAYTLAWPSGRGYEEGFGGRSAGGSQGGRGAREFQGGMQKQGFDGSMGNNGRRYRSNLYSDDDVYGYDATYPNGEAAYINYRSKDARARRGPEFARTSRAYSRQGGASDRNSNFGQMNEYRGGGGGMF